MGRRRKKEERGREGRREERRGREGRGERTLKSIFLSERCQFRKGRTMETVKTSVVAKS
jgi:hypothetical protein